MTAATDGTRYTATDMRGEYDKAYEATATPTIEAVLKAYAAWRAGSVSTDMFGELLVKTLMTANAYARGVADLLATRAAALLFDRPTLRPTGSANLTARTEQRRLSKAVDTLLADLDRPDVDLTARLERIASAEPAQAIQQQSLETMQAHGITGYVRGLENDACELCEWLFKDGYVYPITKPMNQHVGCQCIAIPSDQPIGTRTDLPEAS